MTPFGRIRADHERVRALFDRFEELGPRNHRDRQDMLGEIRGELEAHRTLDHDILYPAARKAGVATETEEGHAIVDRLLAELDDLGTEDRRFTVVFSVLQENVEQHIREEERDILRELERRLAPEPRESLRRRIEERHESARAAAR
jgi:hypothetical protein